MDWRTKSMHDVVVEESNDLCNSSIRHYIELNILAQSINCDNAMLIPFFCSLKRSKMVDYDGFETACWWCNWLKKAEPGTGLVLMQLTKETRKNISTHVDSYTGPAISLQYSRSGLFYSHLAAS